MKQILSTVNIFFVLLLFAQPSNAQEKKIKEPDIKPILFFPCVNKDEFLKNTEQVLKSLNIPTGELKILISPFKIKKEATSASIEDAVAYLVDNKVRHAVHLIVWIEELKACLLVDNLMYSDHPMDIKQFLAIRDWARKTLQPDRNNSKKSK